MGAELLADLLAIFVPIFGLDAWYLRRRRSRHKVYGSHSALAFSLLVSAVACTFFSFPVAGGPRTDLSVVSLTLAFCLVPILYALITLAGFLAVQIVHSIFLMARGHITLTVVHTVLAAVPRASIFILAFAILMSATSLLLARVSPLFRSLGFAVSLFLYGLFDYAYLLRKSMVSPNILSAYIAVVCGFCIVFLIAARLTEEGRQGHQRRLDTLRMERAELISQLSASMAHEIRNPVTVVRGFTQLMMEKEYDRETAQVFLRNMLQELDRAEGVIADYLQLAKQADRHNQSEVDVHKLTEHVVSILQPFALAHNVRLTLHGEGPCWVRGYEAELIQAIMNVVKNGIEATAQAGKDTSGDRSIRDRSVRVSVSAHGRSVEIRVRDAGEGIPKAALKRLGEPYYSTKTQGTGLGLALAYKVIHEAGGDVAVESGEGVGTTFTMKVPRCEAPHLAPHLTPDSSSRDSVPAPSFDPSRERREDDTSFEVESTGRRWTRG